MAENTNNNDTTKSPQTNNGVAVFNYNDFLSGFPNFNGQITELQSQIAFEVACTILNNSPYSAIPDVKKRQLILYVLTAHILTLELQNNIKYGAPTTTETGTTTQQISGGLVGRVTRAERGEVDVELSELDGIPAREQWYTQTQFGFTYLQLIKPYIHAICAPGPVSNFRAGL